MRRRITDNALFDLALVMDVIEHVEDGFGFARNVSLKARWKIYNIPIDVHANATLRGRNIYHWESIGHIHLFTLETALKTISSSGQRVLDWFLVPGLLENPKHKRLETRLMNLLRQPLHKINHLLACRALGGYSVMVLAA